MSFETWRRQQKSAVAAIFKNTMSEATDRTRNHLTEIQDRGNYSQPFISAARIASTGDDFLLPKSDENGDEFDQMVCDLCDTAIDVALTTAKGSIDLMNVGISSFFHMVEIHPTYFNDFLRRTEEFFDAYIRAYCEQENIRFIGGKLRITQPSEETLALTADFYFFTPEETWNVQHKEGALKVEAIIDWEDNPNLAELRGEGYLEYPIEPPEAQ